MVWRTFCSIFLACLHSFSWTTAWTLSGSSFVRRVKQKRSNCDFAARRSRQSSQQILVMRDTSASYWFKLDELVRVVEDVPKAGTNLRGQIGTVVETWEKCEVDPTCCCAEQVDTNMAVRVKFAKTNEQDEFFHYFAEAELVKLTDDELRQMEETSLTSSQQEMQTDQLLFDGLSCKAFKLEQLRPNQRPRQIASFTPTRAEESD